MDYLQYNNGKGFKSMSPESFKPCYKWITFNTVIKVKREVYEFLVSFKPCYKWITFNTVSIS